MSSSAKPMIVVSAHADHLGRGELGELRAGGHEKGLIHYGADDNASGVAVVLETAAALSKMKKEGRPLGNKDILFAVWSGEELGLLGSTYFVKKLMDKPINNSLKSVVDANINLDMVGRLEKYLVVQGIGSSTLWTKLLERVNSKNSFPLITQNDPYLPTDSTSFYLQGVPAINLFTGLHDEYHSARDTPDTLNYEGMNRVTEFLLQLVLALDQETHSIHFQQVSKAKDNLEGGFRVYLGTIPDYSSADISGVKLTGVTKDSPAEKAGVKSNDIIVELAGKKIKDIYDYSYVLRALRPGESAQLVVIRGRNKISLPIVAKARE